MMAPPRACRDHRWARVHGQKVAPGLAALSVTSPQARALEPAHHRPEGRRDSQASGSVRRNPEQARRSARWANGEKWPAPVQTQLEGWSLAFSRPRETRPVPRGRERRREVRQTWTRLSLRPKGCVDATVIPDRREHSSRAIGGSAPPLRLSRPAG